MTATVRPTRGILNQYRYQYKTVSPIRAAYVNETYEPEYEEYATRVTSLKDREIMWEWNLPRATVCSSEEATSKHSWEQTTAALERMQSLSDRNYPAQETGFLDKLRRFF